jgi:hypothetical protein
LVLSDLLLFNRLVLIDHVLIIRLRNSRVALVGNLLNWLGVLAMNDIGYGLMMVAVMGGLHLFIAL